MPCRCQGNPPLPFSRTASADGSVPHTARVAVYEVVKDGEVKISTTSATAAREESRRLGASVRVTSRPVEPANV